MEKKKSVSELMKLEHGKMLSMLVKLKSNKDSDLFKELKELIDNHVFAEEKAIFIFYKEKRKIPVLSQLMEEHNQINKSLKEFEENIDSSLNNKTIATLTNLIKSHTALEDKEFYPHLDKDLSKAEQDDMFKRVKVILGTIKQG